MNTLWDNTILAVVLIVAVAFGVYLNSLNDTFHWDDERLVKDNIHIRTLRNIPIFFNPGYINVYEAGSGERYRPLRSVSFALDYFLWKERPIGYHLTNVVLHTVATVVLWYLARLTTGSNFVAFWSALIFAVHPSHTESVNYVKNRSDIICAIFYLGSLAMLAKYIGGKNVVYYLISLVALIGAFVSKEMGLTIPFAAAGLLLWMKASGKENLSVKKILVLVAPYVFILVGYFAFKKFVMKGFYTYSFPLSLGAHIIFVINTFIEYLKILIFPLKLSLDRFMPANQPLSVAGFWVLVAFLSLTIYFIAVKKYIYAFWLSFVLITLLPVSNIVYLMGRPFAEQRLYIPSSGWCVFLGVVGGGFFNKKNNIAVLILVVLCMLFAARTFARNFEWKDEIILWQKTIQQEKMPYRAYHNLAVAQYRRGNYQEALGNAAKSIEIAPDFAEGYNTLGGIYQKLGLYKKSIEMYEKSLEISRVPNPVVLTNLATVYGLTGDKKKAESIFKEVIKIAPWMDSAYYNLGLLLLGEGKDKEARACLSEALTLNPYNQEARRILAGSYNGK